MIVKILENTHPVLMASSQNSNEAKYQKVDNYSLTSSQNKLKKKLFLFIFHSLLDYFLRQLNSNHQYKDLLLSATLFQYLQTRLTYSNRTHKAQGDRSTLQLYYKHGNVIWLQLYHSIISLRVCSCKPLLPLSNFCKPGTQHNDT